jgi:hypothetical protein
MRDQHDSSFSSMSPLVIIVTISIVTKFAHSHEIGPRKSNHNNIPIYRATLGGWITLKNQSHSNWTQMSHEFVHKDVTCSRAHTNWSFRSWTKWKYWSTHVTRRILIIAQVSKSKFPFRIPNIAYTLFPKITKQALLPHNLITSLTDHNLNY